jgi:hypothetical protein
VRGFVVPLAWINSSLGTDKGKMMMEQERMRTRLRSPIDSHMFRVCKEINCTDFIEK